MRMFLLISDQDVEIAGVVVSIPIIEKVNTQASRYAIDEVQKFFLTATVGDIFQLQHNEYIVALGTVQHASWLGKAW